MEILGTIMQTMFKLIVVGATAFGGLLLGRFIRKKVDEKKQKDIN